MSDTTAEPEAAARPAASTRPTFVWYELITSDAEGAEAFYKEVVGWTATDSGQTEIRYTLLNAGGQPVAGLMTMPDEAAQAGAKPFWLGYVGVEDVDAATRRARDGGGAVHREPADIPDVGRFSMVTDPQGAALALFTPGGKMMDPAPPMTPGTIGWHELHTSNWQGAFDFYADQFGWAKDQAMDMGPMGTYQLFRTSSDTDAVGGMMDSPDFPRPLWLYYLAVDDIDGARARVEALGGEVTLEPTEVPGGAWIIQARDPQGALFALVGPRK